MNVFLTLLVSKELFDRTLLHITHWGLSSPLLMMHVNPCSIYKSLYLLFLTLMLCKIHILTLLRYQENKFCLKLFKLQMLNALKQTNKKACTKDKSKESLVLLLGYQ